MTSETYVERRVPLSHSLSRRRPASRCVINVRERATRGRERKSFVGRTTALEERRKTAEGGVRKSIFTFQTAAPVYKTRRWKKGRLSGGSSHLVLQVMARSYRSKACPRREGLLKSTRDTHLETCPGQGPSTAFWPFKSTPLRRHRGALTSFPRAFRRRPRGSNRRRMNSTALFIPNYARVYSFIRSASIKLRLDDRVFNLYRA